MFEVEQILKMESLECGRAGGELRCREERLSEARKRVIAKKNKGEDNIVEKYNELLDEITNYII